MDIVEVADGQLIEPPLTVEQRLAEHCAYSEATFTNGDYFHLLAKDALALIASQAARIAELEKGLEQLEAANQRLARTRSSETYHMMLTDDGAEDALEVLDDARSRARSLLSRKGVE